MFLPDGEPTGAQKDAEEDWFRHSFTTELATPSFPEPFDLQYEGPPLFSDIETLDADSSDSQQFSFDSPTTVTPPPFSDPTFPYVPHHQRHVSQPASPQFSSSPGSAPLIDPSHTMPKGFSFTKRSLGPRQITGAVDQEFLHLCLDRSVTFNPHHLGFIPSNAWTDAEVRFGDLVTDFFQRKNNANSRFSHKLYNALRITKSDPFYFHYIGVEWISAYILKVDKRIFAQLLGIKSVDGSLFHQQGNFPSHGFVEIGHGEASRHLPEGDLEGVDYERVRLLVHKSRVFIRDATEEDLARCAWVHARKR